MEFKGTQWPWNTVVADSGNAVRVFSWDSTYIGMIGGSDQSHVEISRNARLIAAAPDLLEACLGALRIQSLWYPVASDNDEECAALNSMRKKFESAIAKALGES